jgi:uncharacterized protein (TIRG00374 family)
LNASPPAPHHAPGSGTPRRPLLARLVLPTLRYGLCVVAIAWLVTHVPWHDYTYLNDSEGTRVRMLRSGPDGVEVRLSDGSRRTVPPDELRAVIVGGKPVPDVEYGIPSVVLRMDLSLALLAVLMFMPVPLMAAQRLIWMLGIQDVRLSFWNAVKLTFVGNFFNFALPGTTGGDLIKAYYLTRFTHRKTEAVTTIFLDRVIGLLGMVVLASVLMIASWDEQQFGALARPLALICGVLALGALVIFSQRLRALFGLRALAERLPGRIGEQLLRVGRATVALRQRKRLLSLSFGMTFVLQSIVLISAGVMAWSLGMQGTLGYFVIYVAVGFLLAAVPIAPPQAFGVLEYYYVYVFTRGDANTASQAVALALAVRLIQLVWSLPGVLVPLLGAHLPSQRELAELEHTLGQERTADAKPAATDPRMSEQTLSSTTGRP